MVGGSWEHLRDDMRFEKAKLIGLEVYKGRSHPLYTRIANAASVTISCFGYIFELSWRMPWLKDAVFRKGWDAGFRHKDSQ